MLSSEAQGGQEIDPTHISTRGWGLYHGFSCGSQFLWSSKDCLLRHKAGLGSADSHIQQNQKVRHASRNTHTPSSFYRCSGREIEGPGVSSSLFSKDSGSLRITPSETQDGDSLTLCGKSPSQSEPSCPHCSQSWASHTVAKLRGHSLVPQTRHEEIQYPWAGEGSLIPTNSGLLPQRVCR